LVQSTAPFPIQAPVEGAISKFDLLFLEYVLDLYEEEFLRRESIAGRSLGAEVKADRQQTLDLARKNMAEVKEPAYLLIPSSLLGRVAPRDIERALENPSVHLEVLWDSDEKGAKLAGSAERLDYLKRLGLETITAKKNLHSNVANQALDSAKGLADKVANLSRALSDRGVQTKQISVLKPEMLAANFGSVLALKSTAPYPIFMMLYLIQTQGSLANDLLGILNYDQKTGDYFISLDEELAKLLAERLGAEATAKAA
jgi:hypothetical protein